MAIRSSLLLMAAASLAACGGEATEQNAVENAASVSTGAATSGEAPAGRTIAQTVGGSAEHSTLAGAFRAAGLEATLAGPTPYTLFAPSNDAFAKLPAGASETLMQPEQKARLTSILTYHIVPGVVTAADLARAVEGANGKAILATLGGGNLTVTRSNGGLIITDAKGGEARVTQADLVQSNGIVHVIDAVLMPS